VSTSRIQIQIDFNTACKQADKLEDVANGLKQLANQKLSSAIQDLSSGWTGDNAKAYFAKAENVRSEIIATANNLNAVATTLRSNARRIYNAEMEAVRIAEQDTSS
jgi:WXG100 family type VII secretion target